MAVNQPGCKALWDLMSLDHLPVFCMRNRHWKLSKQFILQVMITDSTKKRTKEQVQLENVRKDLAIHLLKSRISES